MAKEREQRMESNDTVGLKIANVYNLKKKLLEAIKEVISIIFINLNRQFYSSKSKAHNFANNQWTETKVILHP